MRNFHFFGMALALASIAAGVACTTTSVTTPDTTDGGNVNGGDGGGSDDQDGGATGGTFKGGSVTLTQTVVGTTFAQYNATAGFYVTETSGSGPTGDNPCETTTVDTCTVTVCNKVTTTTDAGTDTDAGVSKGLSAGDITVEATETITLTYDATNGIYSKSEQKKLFDTGGQVHIKAAGADVPAFDDTIAAPPAVTLTSPAAPAPGQKLAVDGSQALDVAWTGGAAGTLVVNVISSNDTQSSTLSCKFDASKGSASVPAGATAKLVKGDGVYSTSTETDESLKAGDYTVNLRASSNGTSGLATVN